MTGKEIGSTQLYLRLTPGQRERAGERERGGEGALKSSETTNEHGILSKMDD